MIELYRAMIPTKRVINDNHGQHYRIHQGNLEWLTQQFKRTITGEENTPGEFQIPNLEDILKYVGDKLIEVRCEVWKYNNIVFDPHNYAKTFKAPLDLLVSNGYIKDDSWKHISKISYMGGGSLVWDRAARYEGDNLPDVLTTDWWKQYSDSYVDIMIRIIIE